jgi:hypothetical protein
VLRELSCKCLCKRFCILTLPSEYIFALIFITDNYEMFPSNSEVHKVNTRYKHALYRSTANFSVLKRSILWRNSNVQAPNGNSRPGCYIINSNFLFVWWHILHPWLRPMKDLWNTNKFSSRVYGIRILTVEYLQAISCLCKIKCIICLTFLLLTYCVYLYTNLFHIQGDRDSRYWYTQSTITELSEHKG